MGFNSRQNKRLKRCTDAATHRFMTRFLSPFEEGMNNRIRKEAHVRAKPKLLDTVATGGFGVTRKNKKGGK